MLYTVIHLTNFALRKFHEEEVRGKNMTIWPRKCGGYQTSRQYLICQIISGFDSLKSDGINSNFVRFYYPQEFETWNSSLRPQQVHTETCLNLRTRAVRVPSVSPSSEHQRAVWDRGGLTGSCLHYQEIQGWVAYITSKYKGKLLKLPRNTRVSCLHYQEIQG